MTQQTIQFGLKINADTSAAQASLEKLKNQLLQIQSNKYNPELRMDEDFKKASQAAQELQKHLNFSTDKLGNFNISSFTQSLKMSKTSLTELSTSLLSVGNQGANAFQGLANQILNAQKPALTFSGLLGKMGTTLANNIRWQLSSAAINAFTNSIREAWNYTKNMDEALTNIGVVTGKSRKETTAMADSLNKMAKELKSTSLEMAKSQLIFYQQGDSAELAAEKARIATMAANVSFESSAEEMADYLTAIWNSYQVGEEQLESFVDKLSAVGATTATSMEELATAMTKVAAAANSVGVTYDQLNATIATISSATRVSAESVGTAMKTIYARMGDLKLGKEDEDGLDYGQVSSGLKKMGVDILDAEGNLRDMGKVVEEVGSKWNKWTTAQQQAIVQLMAGKRQYTNLTALFENWDQYLKNLNTSESAVGTLQEQQDTWAQSWEAASNRVTNSLQKSYSNLINDDFMIGLANVIASLIDGINELVDALGGLGPILLQTGAILTKVFNVQIVNFFTRQLINLRSFFNWRGDLQQNLSMLHQIESTNAFKNLSDDQKIVISNFSKLAGLRQEYLSQEKNMTLAQRANYESLLEIYKAHMMINEEAAKTISQSRKDMGAAGRAESGSIRQVDEKDYTPLKRTQQKVLDSEQGSTKVNNLLQHADNLAKKYNLTFEDGGSLEKLKQEIQEGKVSVTTFNGAVKEIENALDSINNKPMTINERIDELSVSLATLNFEEMEKDLISIGEDATQQFNKVKQILEGLGFTVDETIISMQDFGLPALQDDIGTVDQLKEKLKEVGLKNKEIKALNANGIFKGVLEGDKTSIMQLYNELSKLENKDQILEAVFGDSFVDIGAKLTVEDIQKIIAKFKELEAARLAAASGGKVTKEAVNNNIDVRTEAQGNYITSGKKMEEVSGEMGEEFGKSKDKFTQNAQAATQMAGAVMGIVSAVQSVTSTVSVFNDENATFGEKLLSLGGAIGMIAMTLLGSLLPALTTIKENAKATWGAVLGPFAIIVVAIAAVIAIIAGVAKAMENQKQKANDAAIAYEKATARVEEMGKAFDEAAEKYENLKDSMEDYQDSMDSLKKLKEGTLEFKEAVFNANQQVLELMTTYPELAKWVQNIDGVLTIDPEGWEEITNKAFGEKVEALAMKNLAELEKSEAQAALTIETSLHDMAKASEGAIYYQTNVGEAYTTIGGGSSADNSATEEVLAKAFEKYSSAELVDAISKASQSEDYTQLNEMLGVHSGLAEALVENETATLKMIQQYDLNRQAIETNTKALYGIDSKGEARTDGETAIAADEAKKKEQQLQQEYDEIFKSGGDQAKQKELLAAHYGVSTEDIDLSNTAGGDMTIKVRGDNGWEVKEDFNHAGGSGAGDARYSIIANRLAKDNAAKWASSGEADAVIAQRYDKTRSNVDKHINTAMAVKSTIQDNDGKSFDNIEEFKDKYTEKTNKATEEINAAKESLLKGSNINQEDLPEDIQNKMNITFFDADETVQKIDKTTGELVNTGQEAVQEIYDSFEFEEPVDFNFEVRGAELEEQLEGSMDPDEIQEAARENLESSISADEIDLINTESMRAAITDQLIEDGIEDADFDDIQAAFDKVMSEGLMVDPLDFSNMFSGMESAVNGLDSIIDAMSQLQQGTALTKQEMFGLAQQFPELLEASNLFTDGSVAGQQAMLDEILKVKEAEHDAEIDVKIAELEAANLAIDAQIQLENDKMALLKELDQELLNDEYQKQIWLAEYYDKSGKTFADIENGKVYVNQDAGNALLEQNAQTATEMAEGYNYTGEALSEATRQGGEGATKNLNSLGSKISNFVSKAKTLLSNLGGIIKAALDPTRTVADYVTGLWSSMDTTIGSPTDVDITKAIGEYDGSGTINGVDIEDWVNQQVDIKQQTISAFEEKKLANNNAIANLEALKGLDLIGLYGSDGGSGSGGGSGGGSGDNESETQNAFDAALEAWNKMADESSYKTDYGNQSKKKHLENLQGEKYTALLSAYNNLTADEKADAKSNMRTVSTAIASAMKDYYDDEIKAAEDEASNIADLYGIESDAYKQALQAIEDKKTAKSQATFVDFEGTSLNINDDETFDKNAFAEINSKKLERLKAKLENGEISYSDYYQQAKDLIEEKMGDDYLFSFEDREKMLESLVGEDPQLVAEFLSGEVEDSAMSITEALKRFNELLNDPNISEDAKSEVLETMKSTISNQLSSISSDLKNDFVTAEAAIVEYFMILLDPNIPKDSEAYAEIFENIENAVETGTKGIVEKINNGFIDIEVGLQRIENIFEAGWNIEISNKTWNKLGDTYLKTVERQQQFTDTLMSLLEGTISLWETAEISFQEGLKRNQKLIEQYNYAITELDKNKYTNEEKLLEEYIETQTGLYEDGSLTLAQVISNIEENLKTDPDLVKDSIFGLINAELTEIIDKLESKEIDDIATAIANVWDTIIKSGYSNVIEINKLLAEATSRAYSVELDNINSKYEAIDLSQDVADWGKVNQFGSETEWEYNNWFNKLNDLIAARDSYIANYHGTEDIIYDETYQAYLSEIQSMQELGQTLADAAWEERAEILDYRKQAEKDFTINDEIEHLMEDRLRLESGYYQKYFDNQEDYQNWYKEKSLELYETEVEIYKEKAEKIKELMIEEYENRKSLLENQKDLEESRFDSIMELREAQHEINLELQTSLAMYEYLDEETRKLIFNEEDYVALSDEILRIQEEINDLTDVYNDKLLTATTEEAELLTEEYEAQKEIKMQEYEIAKANLEITKKQLALQNTLNERNTRMFVNGQWTWVADPEAVAKAREEILEAEYNAETERLNLEHQEEMKQLDDDIRSLDKKILVVEEAFEDLEDVLDGEDGVTVSLTALKDAIKAAKDAYNDGPSPTPETVPETDVSEQYKNKDTDTLIDIWLDEVKKNGKGSFLGEIYTRSVTEDDKFLFQNSSGEEFTEDRMKEKFKNDYYGYWQNQGNLTIGNKTFVPEMEGKNLHYLDETGKVYTWDEIVKLLDETDFVRNSVLADVLATNKMNTPESTYLKADPSDFDAAHDLETIDTNVETIVNLLSELVSLTNTDMSYFLAKMEAQEKYETTEGSGSILRVGNAEFAHYFSEEKGHYWVDEDGNVYSREGMESVLYGLMDEESKAIYDKEKTRKTRVNAAKETIKETTGTVIPEAWYSSESEDKHGKTEKAKTLASLGYIDSETGYFKDAEKQAEYYKEQISQLIGEDTAKKIFEKVDAAYGSAANAASYYQNLFTEIVNSAKENTTDWVDVASNSFTLGEEKFYEQLVPIFGEKTAKDTEQFLKGININDKYKKYFNQQSKSVYLGDFNRSPNEIDKSNAVSYVTFSEDGKALVDNKGNSIVFSEADKEKYTTDVDGNTFFKSGALQSEFYKNAILATEELDEGFANSLFGFIESEYGGLENSGMIYQAVYDAIVNSTGGDWVQLVAKSFAGGEQAFWDAINTNFNYQGETGIEAFQEGVVLKLTEEEVKAYANAITNSWYPNASETFFTPLLNGLKDVTKTYEEQKGISTIDEPLKNATTIGLNDVKDAINDQAGKLAEVLGYTIEEYEGDDTPTPTADNPPPTPTADNPPPTPTADNPPPTPTVTTPPTGNSNGSTPPTGNSNGSTPPTGNSNGSTSPEEEEGTKETLSLSKLDETFGVTPYTNTERETQKKTLEIDGVEYTKYWTNSGFTVYSSGGKALYSRKYNPALEPDQRYFVKNLAGNKVYVTTKNPFKDTLGYYYFNSVETGTSYYRIIDGPDKGLCAPKKGTIGKKIYYKKGAYDNGKEIAVTLDGEVWGGPDTFWDFGSDWDKIEDYNTFLGRNWSINWYAKGGILNRPTLLPGAGEDGPEAIIPLSPKYRDRGLSLWEEVTKILGITPSLSMPTIRASFPQEKENMNVSQTINVTVQNEDSSNDFYAITNLL